MSIESGAVLLIDSNGNEIAVDNGVATPAGTRGALVMGSDGTNSRFLSVDALGRQVLTGAETPGNPVSGNPVLISGTDGSSVRVIKTATDGVVLTNAAQGTAGTHAQRWMVGLSDGASFISPATDRTTAAAPFATRLSDGSSFYNAPAAGQLPTSLVGGRLDTNIGAWLGSTAPTVGSKTSANSIPVVIASDQGAVTAKSEVQLDYDTGAGTQSLSIQGIALPASGGAVAGGTSTNPIRTDPTGSTIQPVSGTITATQGTAAAANAPWATRLSDGSSFISPALDATLTGGSQKAIVRGGAKGATAAADVTSISVDANTQALHTSITNFPATQPVSGTITATQGTAAAANAPWATRLSDGTSFYKTNTDTQLPASLGQKTMANSLAVTVASDQSAMPVKETRSGTGTASSVSSSATSVTILASNANRLGAAVFNDSTQVLYLLLGSGTASSSNYTVRMVANAYFEVPFGYTGVLSGAWASANGNARVTEFT